MIIRDKVIVVTGGASGLGLATARYLGGEKGARIAILDRDEAGRAMAAEIGDNALFVAADVTNETSMRAAIAEVIDQLGAVHVCINAAALYAAVASALASECIQKMAANEPEVGEERGVFIDVAKGADRASKPACGDIEPRTIAALGALGIRMNVIATGPFMTPSVRALGEAALAALLDRVVAPKRLGDMREFAHCCAFIIENAYLNAETIRLDGASHARRSPA